MKQNIYLIALITGSLLIGSCSNRFYVASDFDRQTADHQKVAVMPVKMVFTGNLPKKMTPEEIAAQEELESQAFQISLYNNILRTNKNGKNPFTVDFISTFETNAKLEENGISIRESWSMDPKELAEILGVDAVVNCTVEKQRYISDIASYAIDAGIGTVRNIPGAEKVFIPGGLSKTNDVHVLLNLTDRISGNVLYSSNRTMQITWTTTPKDAIENINRRITKHFPYRFNN